MVYRNGRPSVMRKGKGGEGGGAEGAVNWQSWQGSGPQSCTLVGGMQCFLSLMAIEEPLDDECKTRTLLGSMPAESCLAIVMYTTKSKHDAQRLCVLSCWSSCHQMTSGHHGILLLKTKVLYK